MSKTIKQQATIRTNDIKGSVCRIEVEAVKFATLWAGYPSSPPYVDPTTGKPPPGYSNQCAIKVSVAIHNAGIEMKSFRAKDKILVNGKNTAALAESLAEWLKQMPFCGLPQRPESVAGKDWETKIKGRTGIVFFANYWKRTPEAKTATGDHIDLWNGSRLTASGLVGTATTVARYLGLRSFHPPGLEDLGYSDLANSSEILFWEIK
jgi:hypothetical protein